MNKLLSLIVPVFNEEEVLPASYARMSAAMQALTGYDYEIIYVNDGSPRRHHEAAPRHSQGA